MKMLVINNIGSKFSQIMIVNVKLLATVMLSVSALDIFKLLSLNKIFWKSQSYTGERWFG